MLRIQTIVCEVPEFKLIMFCTADAFSPQVFISIKKVLKIILSKFSRKKKAKSIKTISSCNFSFTQVAAINFKIIKWFCSKLATS